MNPFSQKFNKAKSVLILMLIVAMLFCTSCRQTEQRKRPNIVIILTDDQGWGDFSCNGNTYAETPVLDSLSHLGATFDRFYVSPLSAPSRASLLTGRYHLRTGVSGVSNREEVLRLNETTFAQIFKNAGYATGCFGKWHNGEQYPYTPNAKGFDEFFGFCAGHWNNYFDTELQHNGLPEKTKGYITDVLADKAIEFITKNQNRPFLCYIPFNAPHSPFQVPDKYFNKYKSKGLDDTTACVYGMVQNIDENVGRIMKALNLLGLDQNTIVVFMTDNGPNTWRYNGNMKGIKSYVDEGGVRVPCFIKYPGVIKPNTIIKSHAAHIDILPTLAEFCHVTLADSIRPDGISLVGLMEGKQKDNLNRLIFAQNKLTNPPISVRDSVYIFVQGKENSFLYNLQTDPGQKIDISAGNADLVRFYNDTINHWYKAVTKNGISPQPFFLGFGYSLPITLSAPEARLGGQLKYFEGHGWANDWITDWKSATDSISWQVNVVEPCRYKVVLKYTGGPEIVGTGIMLSVPDGSINATIEKSFIRELIASPDRVKRKEAYECKWGEINLGTIMLSKGNYPITLKLMKNLKAESIDFKSLSLWKVD